MTAERANDLDHEGGVVACLLPVLLARDQVLDLVDDAH
jgi:hypothetical protein